MSEEGGEKISTEERRLLLLPVPPTTNCPNAKKVKDHTKEIKQLLKQRLDISFFTCFMALTLAFAWNEKERQKYDGTGSHDY